MVGLVVMMWSLWILWWSVSCKDDSLVQRPPQTAWWRRRLIWASSRLLSVCVFSYSLIHIPYTYIIIYPLLPFTLPSTPYQHLSGSCGEFVVRLLLPLLGSVLPFIHNLTLDFVRRQYTSQGSLTTLCSLKPRRLQVTSHASRCLCNKYVRNSSTYLLFVYLFIYRFLSMFYMYFIIHVYLFYLSLTCLHNLHQCDSRREKNPNLSSHTVWWIERNVLFRESYQRWRS